MHAVVLSGGGAHGAYEVGVLEWLLGDRPFLRGEPRHIPRPLPPTVFTGTSVGSYNAAVMTAESASEFADVEDGTGGCRWAIRRLRKHWLERIAEIPDAKPNGAFRVRLMARSRDDARGAAERFATGMRRVAEDAGFLAFDFLKRSVNMALAAQPAARRAVELLDLGYVISTEPIEGLIRDTVNLERLCHPEAKAVRIAATDWDRGQTVVFGNKQASRREQRLLEDEREDVYRPEELTVENAVSAILASTAIPAIFPAIAMPIDSEDHVFVDGVVLMNTPLRPAIEVGATVLHVIYMDPKLRLLPAGHLPSTIDTLSRMLIVSLGQAIKADVESVRRRNERIAMARELKTPRRKLGPKTKQFVADFAEQQQITIHRYFPSRDVGGVLGMLDFEKDRLIELIELGFRDGARHDCEECGCLLPKKMD